MTGDSLIAFLDKIDEEGSSAQQERSDNYDKYTDLYRGKIYPDNMPSWKTKLVVNNLKESIIKKTALLTDVIPTIDVIPTYDEKDMFEAAQMLKIVIGALWEQNTWQLSYEEIIFYDQLYGSVFSNTGWDDDLNWGKGDINIKVGDPRAYIIDPFVSKSHELNEGEYVRYQYFKPTDQLRHEYPEVADAIKSHFDTSEEKKNTFAQFISGFVKKLKKDQGFKPAIERSLIKCYWLKDRTKEDKEQEDGKSKSVMLYPTGRFIRKAGNTILYDKANPYWDGIFPVDMLDWQFDPDSAFGISEVEDLASPFKAYNKLLSLVLENAILNSDTMWIGDTNALAPGQLEKGLLRTKPGRFITKRPSTTLERVEGSDIAKGAVEAAGYMRQIIDDLTGMNEAMRGKKGGAQAAQAIESLQLAAQTTIRYQARRLESLLQRIGQKLIARIFQYYTDDRLMFIAGNTKEVQYFTFQRAKILDPLRKIYEQETNKLMLSADKVTEYITRRGFQNFRFHIMAGSSLAMTKVQKATLLMTLFKMRIIKNKKALLEAMEVGNKDALLKDDETGSEEEKGEPAQKVKLPEHKTQKGLNKVSPLG